MSDLTSNSPTTGAEPNVNGDRYLVFDLNGEHYAIPLLQVKEVIAFTQTTPIPGAASYFRGVLNLRGQVISIIDLRLKLSLKKADIGPETSVIILDLGGSQVGMVVGSVESVVPFEAKDIDHGDGFTSFSQGKYIGGIAKSGDRMILLLDIQQTFGADVKSIQGFTAKSA